MLTEQDGRESSAQIADRNGAWAPPTIMANCRVRMRLMARLQQLMASRRLTQVQAAAWFHVSQSRISHLVNNQANRFTTEPATGDKRVPAGQKTRFGTSAGASSNSSISSSSLTRVNEAPAMSRDVQYSLT